MNSNPFAENILRSLRRITRAIDLHSRELGARFKLTIPQLVVLQELDKNGPLTPSELSRRVFLSQATVTGILNRLESRDLIRRERKHADRRMVTVSLTDQGKQMTDNTPLPLQERFSNRLDALPPKYQEQISLTLQQIVEMMEAQELDAEPIMAPPGPLASENGDASQAETNKKTTGQS